MKIKKARIRQIIQESFMDLISLGRMSSNPNYIPREAEKRDETEIVLAKYREMYPDLAEGGDVYLAKQLIRRNMIFDVLDKGILQNFIQKREEEANKPRRSPLAGGRMMFEDEKSR